ncbi:MAG: substrate-binding domain-containing protein, partial [Rhodoferax sp.]
MHRLQLHYTLGSEGQDPAVRNPLIDLLRAVSQHGSISAAARALGLSYRHVWGELKRWEQTLGQELIQWEKGQRARLTPFGAKLMWAERQAQARLAPQIEALRAALEHSFAQAFDPGVQLLTLFASHDEALSALREHALQGATPLHLDVRFTGSLDAIRALNEGRCTLAGFHTLLDTDAKSPTRSSVKALLQPGQHKIIGFARRYQGLMVAPGNPLRLLGLADLVRTRARFVQRALGSGTRLVLDELLQRQGMAPQSLHTLEHAESSHAAVAQRVASGEADAAVGLESAARAAGRGVIARGPERDHPRWRPTTQGTPAQRPQQA